MPSSTISKSKKYSRKRNYRKRRHSRRMQRKSRSRNAYAYNRRRRTMFGGAPEGIIYSVERFGAGNDSETDNYRALNKLVESGYVVADSEFKRYVTSKKFVDIIDDKFKKEGIQKQLPDSSITLQQVEIINGDERKIEVKEGESLIGYVILTSLPSEQYARIQSLPDYNRQ
jgi:hypothetical protein